MVILKLLIALGAMFLISCSIIPVDQSRTLNDILRYQKIKKCKSPDLEITIYVERPIENPEEDIFTKNIKMEVAVPRSEGILILTLYHETTTDTRANKIIDRTFSTLETPKIQNIFSEPSLTFGELQKLFAEIAMPYSELIDRCIYKF